MVLNPNCYNIIEGGNIPPVNFGKNNHQFGNPISDEVKLKISESRKGKHSGKDHWNYNNNILKNKEEECFRLYKNGSSLKKLSEYFGVGDSTIYYCLIKDEECKILLKQNNTKNKRVLNDSQIEEVIKMKTNGFSLRKIGRHFGVTHHTISKYINNLGGK